MLSRRKQRVEAAELTRLRNSPEEAGLRRTRLGSKVKREPRNVAGVPPYNQPGARCKTVEICTNQTPKRLSKTDQWTSTFSSPSNDELQQEIFWDPQSPTPYRIENEKRKRTGKCAVEISDIVKRIAPREEKPTSSGVALLGMWIGDNAIPCTPAVAKMRTRSKLSAAKHKIKNTDEELMKLAKQFDQNLVDAIQEQDHQDQTQILAGGETFMSKGSSGQIQEVGSLQGTVPEGSNALTLHPVTMSSGIPVAEQCLRNSLKSVDHETEAAFNALFDSSTQKCSGTLSQCLSDSSQKSSQGNSFSTETKKDLVLHTKDEIQHNAAILDIRPRSATVFSTEDQIQLADRKQPARPDTVIPMATNQDDFDDWGTDLLEDDSFLMQITQNPEVIKTPQNNIPISKLSVQTLVSSEDTKLFVQSDGKITLSSKVNNYQFKHSKSFKGTDVSNAPVVKQVHRSDYPKEECSFLQNAKGFKRDNVHSFEPRTPKEAVKMTSQVLMKPEDNNAKESVQLFDIPVKDTQIEMRSQQPDKLHIPIRPNVPISQSDTSNQKSASFQTKHHNPSDDWNDPKFSDEILDMFCGSDSLFEPNEEEDDLLYQVCDDIEKLTQTEEAKKENEKDEDVERGNKVSNADSNKGFLLTKAAEAFESMHTNPSNKSTFSLATKSKLKSSTSNEITAIRNINSTHLKAPVSSKLPSWNRHGISQDFEQVTCGSTTNQLQVKFNRSNSTPDEQFRSASLIHLKDPAKPLSNNVNKALDAPSLKKFSFTKIRTSQLTGVDVDHNSSRSQNVFRTETHLQCGETKTLSAIHGNLPVSQHQPLKRQLSESFLQSAKVLTTEERSQKCSQEEIERKKREALERRKKRTQPLLQHT
ncbi:hypothetical protein NDU88_008819 [Pleurodeles waltl]|uniref:Ewing's tumor-associated antigen 1 n=1 Tax=Pleurodeles waltl TaxID=8319 RepID=A0AAV7RY01_PLEWA|nr:hypothetical protein NDU88_008819 [Pleurodeles waltl]